MFGILLLASLTVSLIGLLLLITVALENDGGKIASSIFVLGLMVSLPFCLKAETDKVEDLKNRTRISTNVVIQSAGLLWQNGECTQAFQLKDTPVLETKCSSFVWNGSEVPPRVGDVMKVKFLLSDYQYGKPFVLEVQNLTQEIQHVDGVVCSESGVNKCEIRIQPGILESPAGLQLELQVK